VIRAAQGHVLIDMSGVSFVGSLGMRMLIAAARTADRTGRKVAIFGVQPAVAEVFRAFRRGLQPDGRGLAAAAV
jgi:anti-anti-sigma factor